MGAGQRNASYAAQPLLRDLHSLFDRSVRAEASLQGQTPRADELLTASGYPAWVTLLTNGRALPGRG
jgi:hypothetical protein